MIHHNNKTYAILSLRGYLTHVNLIGSLNSQIWYSLGVSYTLGGPFYDWWRTMIIFKFLWSLFGVRLFNQDGVLLFQKHVLMSQHTQKHPKNKNTNVSTECSTINGVWNVFFFFLFIYLIGIQRNSSSVVPFCYTYFKFSFLELLFIVQFRSMCGCISIIVVSVKTTIIVDFLFSLQYW